MSLALADRANPDLVGSIDAIDLLMREPWPDRDQVARSAARLSEDLNRWLATFDESAFRQTELRTLIATIVADPQQFESITSNWDGATQFYLACRAWLRSDLEEQARSSRLQSGEGDRLREQVDALRAVGTSLAFPEDDLDSPGARGEPSPWSESPGPIIEAIKVLLEKLELDPGGGSGADLPTPSH
jgi:hypothetical protein